MKKTLLFTMTGAITLFAVAAAVQAAGAEFDQRNLPWGTEVAPADHDFTPGPEALFTFPSDDSSVIGSVGFVDTEQVGFFWSVVRGDSVTERFTGPPTANTYSLDVDVITNSLNDTPVNWEVNINGVTVDNFDVPLGFVGTIRRSASFPQISGPVYTVELRVTNEIIGGGGSHTLRYAGFGVNQIDITQGTVLCLDTFCDTLVCGLDNGNIVACSWNWTCTGTDNEAMLGAKFGPDIVIGGEINALARTEAWTIDVPSSTLELYLWDSIGQSTLLATDTYTLNSCDFARSDRPSIHDSLE